MPRGTVVAVTAAPETSVPGTALPDTGVPDGTAAAAGPGSVTGSAALAPAGSRPADSGSPAVAVEAVPSPAPAPATERSAVRSSAGQPAGAERAGLDVAAAGRAAVEPAGAEPPAVSMAAAGRPAARTSHSGQTPAVAGEPRGLRRDWLAPFPVDVRVLLGIHRRGPADPAYRNDSQGAIWRTSLTPAGPVTLRVIARRVETPGTGAGARGRWAATQVTAMAWGPGAEWQLTVLPDLLGASDEPARFQPVHRLIHDMVVQHPGVRIGRSGRVFEALVPAVLEQKVVTLEAFRAWRLLLRRFGLPAPGPAPAGLRVCPPAATWGAIPTWEWHRAGVEGVRVATIRGAARLAGRLEQLVTLPMAEADRLLQTLPGIGPWTSAHIRQRSCGDPDAIPVGDHNLPGIVGYALTGRITDDAGMLELLSPYPGQRNRAASLLGMSGRRPPRHGHRNSVRDYRSI